MPARALSVLALGMAHGMRPALLSVPKDVGFALPNTRNGIEAKHKAAPALAMGNGKSSGVIPRISGQILASASFLFFQTILNNLFIRI